MRREYKPRNAHLEDGYAIGMTVEEIIKFEEENGMFDIKREVENVPFYGRRDEMNKFYYTAHNATCLINGMAGSSKNGKKRWLNIFE